MQSDGLCSAFQLHSLMSLILQTHGPWCIICYNVKQISTGYWLQAFESIQCSLTYHSFAVLTHGLCYTETAVRYGNGKYNFKTHLSEEHRLRVVEKLHNELCLL
jgi:hypothetical protein